MQMSANPKDSAVVGHFSFSELTFSVPPFKVAVSSRPTPIEEHEKDCRSGEGYKQARDE